MRKTIYLSLLAIGMMAGGCGEEKPEKDTWYCLECECWKDHIVYRSWKENGFWKYEIYNNINTDITLVYTAGTEESGYEEKQLLIKTGKESGVIDTDIPESRFLELGLSSVIEMKDGEPYRPIVCELKHSWE